MKKLLVVTVVILFFGILAHAQDRPKKITCSYNK